MTGSPWVVALGVATFLLCWVPMVAASNNPTNRNAMFAVLAGFMLGLVGLLLIAVGASGSSGPVDY